jgi:hypothetical protein
MKMLDVSRYKILIFDSVNHYLAHQRKLIVFSSINEFIGSTISFHQPDSPIT